MADSKSKLLRLGGRALAGLIGHIAKTSTVVLEPSDLKTRLRDIHPCIVAVWHGQFMMASILRPEGAKVSAMVARHGDAELIRELMRRIDVQVVEGAGAGERKRDRGGAAALRASLKALAQGSSLVMTADVPPGPARVAGLGIVTLARMSGLPIVPAAVATSRFASFDTWSRMTVNFPYSKLAIVVGEPVEVPRDADANTLEKKRLDVQIRLNDATRRAYQLAGADVRRATPLDQLAAAEPPEPGLALKVYRGMMSALRPAVSTLIGARVRRGKEDLLRRDERRGIAGQPRPAGEVIWVHAASVGETTAVLPLIEELLKANPQSHVLLTTGTVTSANIAAQRLPDRTLHQYVPLDIPQYVSRFLDHWKPAVSIFTESDIWPNLVLETARQRIPLILVNARMSPRSIRRWRRFARTGRPLFSRFSIVLAQNASVNRAIKRLGAPNVITTGNLKIDAPPLSCDPAAVAEFQSTLNGRPLFVAASTHPGEDTVVAAAHALMRDVAGLLTVIVPRHPARGAELAASIAALGLKTQLRSDCRPPKPDTQIYVADTLGELGIFYSMSAVSFVGGSLIEHGGQNPIEPARLGSCILTGPFTHNFRDAYAALFSNNGAIEVRSSDDIARAVTRLLSDKKAADELRHGAEEALQSLGGALAKTLAAIQPLIARQRM